MVTLEPRGRVTNTSDREHWLIFSDDWGRHPSSCQYLTRRLLNRVEVTWVNTIGMRPPRWDRATLDRVVGKLYQAAKPKTRIVDTNKDDRRPRVLSPWMWPWFKRCWDRDWNRWLLGTQLRRLLARVPRPSIALTTIPIVADLMGQLPVDRWVYYCVDDFSQWPGLDQETMGRMEECVIRRADSLIAASVSLQDRLRRLGRDAELCTHGVDLETWQVPGPITFRWPLPIAGPTALFWGVIDRRLDTPLLSHLATTYPELSIVLVGPTQQPDPALRSLPNIHFLPPVDIRQLSAMAQSADCLIMPYVKTPLTHAMQPLKLKEYLATGRPAVVRRLPSTVPWVEACDVIDTAEELVQAVRYRIEHGISAAQQVARQKLAEESWSHKAVDFYRMVRHGA